MIRVENKAREAPTTRLDASIAAEIRACRACAAEFAATIDGHEPRPVLRVSSAATICVAGQAPGVRVHRTGLPFNDPSGDRLRAWMGVDRETFYDSARIATLPMAFCFPGHDAKGGDLPPPRRCADLWRERLFAAHPRFELVLLVGGRAQAWHLKGQSLGGVSETVRRWREVYEARERPRFFPLPHPSWRNNHWLKRNPWFAEETLPALRAALAPLLARPPGKA